MDRNAMVFRPEIRGTTARISTQVFCLSLLMPLGIARALTTASSDQEPVLNEVVVTAQKYTSAVRATPISISAVTGEQLTAAGITNVEAELLLGYRF
jgi:hypothetical protein